MQAASHSLLMGRTLLTTGGMEAQGKPEGANSGVLKVNVCMHANGIMKDNHRGEGSTSFQRKAECVGSGRLHILKGSENNE